MDRRHQAALFLRVTCLKRVAAGAKRYNTRVFSYELMCRRCNWRTLCGIDDAVARLRLIGLLRREPDPDCDVVASLFVDSAPRMTCPICKEKSLSAAPADDADGDGWQAAILCEVCGAAIPAERLAAIPDATRCARCQGLAEAGQLAAVDQDFCPHCGALVEIRMSRGAGITRYKRFCTGEPPCRL
jgi:hypothetical protein